MSPGASQILHQPVGKSFYGDFAAAHETGAGQAMGAESRIPRTFDRPALE
jgi:hypothetical protein